jgi:hypothetical protein
LHVRGAPACPGVSEKSFRFKEKNVGISTGVVIGLVVLLISIGFVVLMMASEWSQPAQAQPLAENPAAAPKAPAPRAAASKAKAKKKPAKKAAKKKK